MAIGAATGNRGFALGISSAVAAASYLVSSMSPVVSWLEPAKYASLFYYAVGNNQLGDGLWPSAFAVLAGVAAVLTLVTIRIFRVTRPHGMTHRRPPDQRPSASGAAAS